MQFSVTLVYVAVMLAYAVPGFLLIRSRAVAPEHIASFSKLLLFVAQPCQVIASFQKISFQRSIVKNMLIFLGLSFLIQSLFLLCFWLILRKRYERIETRVFTIASFMTNCTFMGVPLLEKLMPSHPEAAVYAMMFSMSMNILAWTVCAYIITGEKRYISLKKILINPAVLPLFAAVPLFLTNTALPGAVGEMVELLGKMTTPLCMLVLGMRLATVRWRETFLVPAHYLMTAVNQIAMPVMAWVLCRVFHVAKDVRSALIIVCCCPIAAIVLNLTEILKGGQKTAGALVLTGSILSVFTIPLMTSFLL